MNESPKRRRTVHNETETSSPKKKEKSGKGKNIFFTILKVIIIVGILGVFIVGGAVFGLVTSVVKDLPKVDPSAIESMLDENSVILDNNGNVLQQIQSEGVVRTKVKLSEIDEDLINAFISTEDKTFMTHSGFNFRRLVGATLEGIKEMRMPRGTSTITQQLARNIYLSAIKSEKSLDRKIKEAYYAIEIEKYLSKEQILQAYLNTIFLGGEAYGVQAAAQTYFSKDASDLEVHEAALIGGITANPSKNKPTLNKLKENVKETDYVYETDGMYTLVFNESCLDRYNLVLYNMYNNGKISKEEYEAAKAIDLKTTIKPGKKKVTDISSAFIDLATKDVVNDLSRELGITQDEARNMLYTQGLKIHSTLDVDMQKTLEKNYSVNENFPKINLKFDGNKNIINSKDRKIILYKKDNIISKEGNLIIPKGNYQFTSNGDLVLSKNKFLSFIPLYNDNKEIVNYSLRLKNTYEINDDILYTFNGGSLKIASNYKSMNDNKDMVISKEFLTENNDFFVKDSNENLLVDAKNFSISSTPTIQPQSSSVIMDYRTGIVKAMIGGRNVKGQKQYNRAIQPRQPGSAIKPIAVYGPALDNGYTAASIIDDVPHYRDDGVRWPKNWYEKSSNPKYTGYWGMQTLRDALAWSQNVPAVKLSKEIGVQTSINYLNKLGITTLDLQGGVNDMNNSAMALGGMTNGISPLEMTAAFGAMANKGIYVSPKTYTKVTDKFGTVVLESKSIQRKVYSPETAFLLTDIMKDGGNTGSAAKVANMPISGKTGTTSNNFDAWFVGYTPYYVSSVWIGNDFNTKLSSGSKVSAALWSKIMTDIHKDLEAKPIMDQPSNIIRVPIDKVSGKLATELTSRDPRGSMVKNEYFVKGTEPLEYDDSHVEVVVCASSEKLATNYCPGILIGTKVMIKRPEPYNPEENDGFVPRDYQYEAPTEYCDVHSFMPNPMTRFNNPADGQVLPDGTVIYPDGTKVYPNGVVTAPINSYDPTNTDNSGVEIIDNTNNN